MGKREDRYNRRRLRMAYFTSVLSIAMVLFVLGVLATITLSGHKLSGYMKEQLKLQVVMNYGVPEEDVEELRFMLEEAPYTRNATLISADDALQEFISERGENPMDVLDENPLPSSIELTLKPEYANTDSIQLIETSLMLAHGDQIFEVHKDEKMIDNVNGNIGKIRYGLLGVFALLTLVMIALINNTIRLAIYSKRFLIKTMQLVGATGSFIRRPFIYSGLLQGMVAGILSIIMLTAFSWWMVQQLPAAMFSVDDYASFGAIFLGILLAGLFISYISTFMAVRKFLRLKADALY